MFWCEVFIFFWINLFEVINGKPFVNFAQISDHASFGKFGAPFLPFGGPRGHFGGNLPSPLGCVLFSVFEISITTIGH